MSTPSPIASGSCVNASSILPGGVQQDELVVLRVRRVPGVLRHVCSDRFGDHRALGEPMIVIFSFGFCCATASSRCVVPSAMEWPMVWGQ